MTEELNDKILTEIKNRKPDITIDFIDYFSNYVLSNIESEPSLIVYTDDYIEFSWTQEKLKYNFQYLQLNFHYDKNISCIVQSGAIKTIDNAQNFSIIINQAVKK